MVLLGWDAYLACVVKHGDGVTSYLGKVWTWFSLKGYDATVSAAQREVRPGEEVEVFLLEGLARRG